MTTPHPTTIALLANRIASGSSGALLLLSALVIGCGTAGPAPSGGPAKQFADQEIVVFAAASTTDAINGIKAAFEERSGGRVQASYAASSTLAQQIAQGAGADVFLSANVKWVDFLDQKGLIAERRDLLGNRLVIIVPADSPLKIARPDDLAAPAVKHVALADPQAVPAGIYAREALTKLGLWDRLKDKVAAGQDVRAALAYVETGAAEAGIVYATDAAISDRVRVAVELPAELTQPIVYPAVLLKRAVDRPAARSFYQYLASPEAAKVFEKFGFELLADLSEAGGPSSTTSADAP